MAARVTVIRIGTLFQNLEHMGEFIEFGSGTRRRNKYMVSRRKIGYTVESVAM